jgi:UDP-glucose 4-epimerase
LLAEGHNVVVLDDLSVGQRENVPAGAELVVGDLRDPQTVARALEGVDVVFHQAARVSIRRSVDQFADDADVNIGGTLGLLDAVRRSSVRKLVYASSMAVYGDAESLPIHESHPTVPTSPYGMSKLAAEWYCLHVCGQAGVDAVALRYFNIYGPGQKLSPYVGVISIFIDKILHGEPPLIFGDGEQIRDFVSVHDVVEANLAALRNSCPGAVINVGSGEGMTVNAVARLLLEKMGSALAPVYAPRQPGEPASSIASVERGRSLLDWRARRQIREAIDEVIDYRRSLETVSVVAGGKELHAG